MSKKLSKEDFFIKPGFICFSKESVNFFTVVGSGIIVTIFDFRLKFGGMNYYVRPIRESPLHSKPVYACPAIIGLLKIFTENGSNIDDLEAHIFGGAKNPCAKGYVDGLAEHNAKVGFEILEKKKIRITGRDIGGNRGRKVVFNSATGEIIIAKVDKIRPSDWYPPVNLS